MTDFILRAIKGIPLVAAENDANLLLAYDGWTSVKALGVVGDGETDDRAAILAAAVLSPRLHFPPGDYVISADCTIDAEVRFAPGARLVPGDGVLVFLAKPYHADDYDHVFDLSNGGWVRGTATAKGYLTPQHFGALAIDTVGDDTVGIERALRFAANTPTRFDAAAGIDVMLPVPKDGGAYHITKDIDFNRCSHLYGQGVGVGGFLPVRVKVASTCKAAFFMSPGMGVNQPMHVKEYYTRRYLDGIAGPELRRVRHNGVTYISTTAHTSAAASEPGVGAGAAAIWLSLGAEEPWEENWATGVAYTPAEYYAGQKGAISNLHIEAVTPGGVDFGCVHSTIFTFTNITCKGFALAGFFTHSQSPGAMSQTAPNYGSPIAVDGSASFNGNANGSLFDSCRAIENLGFGFAMLGANAQIILYENCEAIGNKFAGIYDSSAVGNTLINCYAEGNLTRVKNGSTVYMCIKMHKADNTAPSASGGGVGSEPGVGANWTRYWLPLEGTDFDETWSSTGTYAPCGGFNQYKTSGVNPAIYGWNGEGDGGLVIIRGGSYFSGGRADLVLKHTEFGGTTLGSHAFRSDIQWSYQNGAHLYGSGIGATGRLLQFQSSKDAVIRFGWANTRRAYEFSREAAPVILSISGEDWDRGGHTGPGRTFAQNGFLLGDKDSTEICEVRSAANLAAITGAVTKSTIWFYSEPSGGKVGAMCTTSGNVGSGAVVKEFS